MPGYRQSFILYKRKRKKGHVWYYRLADEKTGHSTGKTLKRAAFEFVENEILPHIGKLSQVTLGQYLQPYFVWDTCPHVQRLLTEGKSISPRYAKDQRRRLEMYVLDDPICGIAIEYLRRADILDFRQRLVSPHHGSVVGPRTANCTIGALKTVIREAFYREDIDRDPTASCAKTRPDFRMFRQRKHLAGQTSSVVGNPTPKIKVRIHGSSFRKMCYLPRHVRLSTLLHPAHSRLDQHGSAALDVDHRLSH